MDIAAHTENVRFHIILLKNFRSQIRRIAFALIWSILVGQVQLLFLLRLFFLYTAQKMLDIRKAI